MDRIYLKGIECRVRLGVPEWERKRKQKISIDMVMELDLSEAGRSDAMQDTIDYAQVERTVRECSETGETKLAERLAKKICEIVLSLDARIESVGVSIHKRPKVMSKTSEVIVEITRRRD